MLVYDTGFPSGSKERVRGARLAIHGHRALRENDTTLPADLKRGLIRAVDGELNYPCSIPSRSVMIAYDGREYVDQGPYAYTAGACIWICQRTFEDRQERLKAVLLHELVHVLCGNEVDSEVFEHLLFEQGATLTAADARAFALKNWTGRWVRVVRRSDNNQVEVRDQSGRAISIPQNWVDALGIFVNTIPFV